jgi:hypothetical protein
MRRRLVAANLVGLAVRLYTADKILRIGNLGLRETGREAWPGIQSGCWT